MLLSPRDFVLDSCPYYRFPTSPKLWDQWDFKLANLADIVHCETNLEHCFPYNRRQTSASGNLSSEIAQSFSIATHRNR